MASYILRRLALMIPTILGIMLISFTIIQFAPGGPVERIIAQLQGHDVGATARFAGGQSEMNNLSSGNFDGGSKYRGALGLDPAFIEELEKQFGFDKPAHERFLIMIGDYAQFDFGNSFYRDVPVAQLIAE